MCWHIFLRPVEHIGTKRFPASTDSRITTWAKILTLSINTKREMNIHEQTSTFLKFFHKLSHGGYLLFPAALIAACWSNTWPEAYSHFWHTPLAISLGSHSFSFSLGHWVNDVLMTFFFFLVGLEIKRELLVGGLSEKRNAVLPVAAAVGGMILPALIFIGFNQQMPEAKGWGIPMATDIAFSLAVLGILGSRIPFGIRLFLTAFAIADDLGAVLVIALFYTAEINLLFLAASVALLAALGLLNRFWVRSVIPYFFLGAMLWITISLAGLHATVAGVLVAMFIPSKGRYDMATFLNQLDNHTQSIRENNGGSSDIMLNRALLNNVLAIDHACRDIETPLQRLELAHAQWVSMVVLPLFALANTGIVLEGIDLIQALAHPIALGIGVGLVLGKSLGVFGATYIASKLFRLPLGEGFTWTRMLGIGFMGGIGFTMSLFISGLSYQNPLLIDYAKIGIIAGSLVSALCGYLILRFDTRPGR